jgi:putative Mg2+ transporter-C (MgtC) family protein
MIGNYEIVFRLLLSGVLGGLIGIEREANNRPAGFRTHVLVAIGSALVMLISMYGFLGLGTNGEGGEPARLASQVVSGIGFLGAGTILKQGNSITGLTTAASLWVVGCIGLAIGNGYYLGGIITAGIVLFTLCTLNSFEKHIFKDKYKTLIVIAKERVGLIGEIGTFLGEHNILLKSINIYTIEDKTGDIQISLYIKGPHDLLMNTIVLEIVNISGVKTASWEDDLIIEETNHCN